MFQGGKRGVCVMEGEDEQRLLASIRTIVKDVVQEENKVLSDTIIKRFEAVESRQEQLEHRIEELERKVGRHPGSDGMSSASPRKFAPEFVEVKGFCSWNDRLSKGASRSDADQLMQLLVPLLPGSLKEHVKPFELRGLRNYSIKIPVSSHVIREVKGIWSESMKAKRVCGPGNSKLYVTLQKSPDQRAKYAAMGKVFEFVKGLKPDLTFKAFWAPDFVIYAEKSQGLPVLLVSVAPDSSIVWEERCQEILDISPSEAGDQLAVFRRK